MAIITSNIIFDLVGLVIVVIFILILYFKRAFNYWKSKNVPYVEPIIPWGSLVPPHKRTEPIGDEVARIYRDAKKKGWKHLGFYILNGPIFMTTDLETLKCILTKDFNHFVDRGLIVNEKVEPITGHIFFLGGKKWRNLRTKFTPTFTSGKMRHMFETIADCGVKLEQYILKEISYHEPFDIKDILGNFATDIIGSCAFGLEINSFTDPNNPFRLMGRKIFLRSPVGNLKFLLVSNFPSIGRLLKLKLLDPEVTKFFTKVVIDTVNYREKNNVQRHDFLQLLIDMKNNKDASKQPGDGKCLTINEMVAQCFVFFIAGFETSATTMAFALYELSKHLNIQKKVREEIDRVLRKHNDAVTYDSISEMKYLRQVIDETLRKYPAAPFITRQCVEDYVVPGTDIKIDKGVRVYIPIKGIHYDEEYYKNPEVFDPDRFTDENKQKLKPYAYIPFGEGPRMCIGMRFGIMQSKVGLVSILKNFKVSLNNKTKEPLKFLAASMIPQVEGGIWLNLEKI
ncbi:unnamed protein product [Psylliodes chrysocephalus]|uniref:Cytochrome P450 n=1 Tax=Psylliodes chrysocephalus TaxID=3402493 RepID=A0A9P0CRI0_9CUCU|nr:unnamed protein product [Psylliodes chrysocephala]